MPARAPDTYSGEGDRMIINWPATLGLLLLMGLFIASGLSRLQIDTDILTALPPDDVVIQSARQVMQNHPHQNQIAMNITLTDLSVSDSPPLDPADWPDVLVNAAVKLEAALTATELFESTSTNSRSTLLPLALQFITAHLPLLFTAEELQTQVAPRLTAEALQDHLDRQQHNLQHLSGIGQLALITQDPLELRYLVLARLRHLAPIEQARFHRDQLISPDGRHLLLMMKPRAEAGQVPGPAALEYAFNEAAVGVIQTFADQGIDLEITPLGQYRMALDNEQIARRDVQRAITLATLGIALLLLVTFPRPACGLLALLPALAGSLLGLALYGLLFERISMLALGFGGAIIAITVDHGIAYSLFLDRPRPVQAREAARAVWAVGLLAALTTMGAFMLLTLSGFTILAQVGWFATLGIAFAFGWVHGILPVVIPFLPAAKRRPPRVLQRVADGLLGGHSRWRLILAAIIPLVLLPFMRVNVDTDLRSLNTISPATRQAEALLARTWGDVMSHPLIVLEAPTLTELRNLADQAGFILDQAVEDRQLQSAFCGVQVFPGPERAERNLKAWKDFWQTMEPGWPLRFRELALAAGFTADAFQPFLDQIAIPPAAADLHIPAELGILGGWFQDESHQRWIQMGRLQPGPNYNPELLFEWLSTRQGVWLLDGPLFAARLGDYLARSFSLMLLIVGGGLVVGLLVFFADLRLTLLALAPVALALLGSLGTLGLLNRPLDIAGLMLMIVVVGLSIDYALFLIRAHQHYGTDGHSASALGRVRLTVCLSALSSLLGFGVLALASHNLLQSAGLAAFLGILYGTLGTILILPPLLFRWYGRGV